MSLQSITQEGPQITTYILQDFSASLPDGVKFRVDPIGSPQWSSIDGAPYVVLHLRLTPPSGARAELFDLNCEIQLEFEADLPRGGHDRKLTLQNHHQSRISAYQVNCLVPRDPGIRILAQNRNYSQSVYELDFVQAGARSDQSALARLQAMWLQSQWTQGMAKPLGTIALLLFVWLGLLLGHRFQAKS